MMEMKTTASELAGGGDGPVFIETLAAKEKL